MKIRNPKLELVTIGADAAASTEIDLKGFAGGSFQLPAGSTTTRVDVYASLGANAYAQAYDGGASLQIRGLSELKPETLPDAIYKFEKIKLIAGVGGATASVPVYLNS